MPQFGKNVLSQFLRTKCDKQLRLSLYTPTELQSLGWPVPLVARPAVQILRDRGIEWEQAKMADLEGAFGSAIQGDKRNSRFREIELLGVLQRNPPSPTFVLQPSFSDPNLKPTFLTNLGLSTSAITQIPSFGSFRPDIISIQTRADDEIEVMPSGATKAVVQGDQRKALLIFDIKHAGSANSSYSSEVALYAVLLANWLRLVGLDDRFMVSSRMALWTRSKEISSLTQLLVANPAASISERIAALWDDFEEVEFSIFFQSIEHFFKVDLLRVLSAANWTQLDWHVDSRCSACDFLGHRAWVVTADRPRLDANRNHYCIPAAEDTQHLSRLATITRGGRKTLASSGHSDLGAVSTISATDPVFEQHNSLKADRNHLSHRADSIISGNFSIAPNTTTVDFPKWADLEIFLSVNFDPGTGLLTALGSEARFRQRVPFGQTTIVGRVWNADAQALLSPTIDEERNVLMSFLSRLGDVFAHVNDPDPQRGGALASTTRTQIYFWDRRQFEALTKAVGRHLNVIVLPQNDRYLRGLAWLFPSEQTLQEDEITLANPITFVKPVIQRDLRLPVVHSQTNFNVAEVYYTAPYAPRVPDSFYRDPLSDMIPRERIYEIWSGEPLISLGRIQKTRSQCISSYSEAVKQQVGALRSIVWKFRSDMGSRLNFAARPINLRVPFNFQNISEDGRLWYGWAKLEEAVDEVERRRTWACEPEELEAKYAVLRFSNLVSQSGNILEFDVVPTSQDCKFRDGAGFLALQDEAIPGFLDLPVKKVLPPTQHSQLSFADLNRKLSNVFQAELLAYDRGGLRATVRLTDFGNSAAIRQLLLSSGVIDLSTEASLVEGGSPTMAARIHQCLVEIGRPSIAAAAPQTYSTLGHAPGTNLPRTDTETFASRVLWNANALAVENTNLQLAEIVSAANEIAGCGWPFNNSQEGAVRHCLSHRLSVVWGPPGTGKTTTAAALIAARILIARSTDTKLRLLVTGPTYTAWETLFNEALELLGKLGITDIDCYRVYAPSHGNRAAIPSSPGPTVTDATPDTTDSNFQALISQLRNPSNIVLVGTVAHQCFQITKKSNGTALSSFFDFAIVDESSQLDVGKSLYPLCLLATGAEIALFGDHLQMPPVVATQPPKNAEWLVGSIQSYLIRRHQVPTQNLLVNYRSSEPFVAFEKRIGYPPGLTAHSPDLRGHLLIPPTSAPTGWSGDIVWFPQLGEIINPEKRLLAITYDDGRAGQANQFEADLVCGIVQQLFQSMSTALENELDGNGVLKPCVHGSYTPERFWERGVGIVTPHRAQRALIVRRLQDMFPLHPSEAIENAVDTVERFQGGQRDTIIISFGVGDPDLIADEECFLLQLERTNVAISRARAKCILAISNDLAYHLPADKETIQTSKAVKCFVSDFCCNVTSFDVSTGVATRTITVRSH